MKKISKLLILNTENIKQCFKQLNLSQEKILICINKKKEFQGVITDGDEERCVSGKALHEVGVNDLVANEGRNQQFAGEERALLGLTGNELRHG